jgi:hypothetical protein
MRRRRKQSELDKELADNARLLRAWKAFHRVQLEEALAGLHGVQVSELMTLLDRLKLSSAAALLAFIERTDWHEVDYGTRLTVLHQINDRITRMRARHGLPPFDDPLPGQPDNVFRRIKHTLFSPSPAHARRLPSSVATERTGRDVTATVQMMKE